MSTPEERGDVIDISETRSEQQPSQEQQFVDAFTEFLNNQRIYYPDITKINVHGAINDHPFSVEIREV